MPLIFSGSLYEYEKCIIACAGFFCFNAASSSVYLINDICDLTCDRFHPIKKNRPLARGDLTTRNVFSLALLLLLVAVVCGFLLDRTFGVIIVIYSAANVLYSKFLKHMIILDVLSIACFFILRVVAGSSVVHVEASYWLLICTFMVATFLGFAKRRYELISLETNAGSHRKVLGHYSAYFLDQMIAVVTTSTLMSYILYTVSDETFRKFSTRNLLYTTPFVLYGIFRYLYLIHRKEEGGDTASLILSDKGMVINLLLWGVVVVVVIYSG
jgi:4-hydroxybenzoate polyprenyltransferase